MGKDNTQKGNVVNKKMTTLSNETEYALAGLAQLLDIKIQHGWKTRVAERLGVDLRVLSKWINRNRIPRYIERKLKSQGTVPQDWPILPDDILMAKVSDMGRRNGDISLSPPPESTKSPGPILTGTVAQERRSPWHPDPRKNELLRMAAFVLEADDPEITPAFEQEIIKAHNALVRGRHPKPEAKKAINQS